jgi:hypothetical protein
MSRRTVVTVAVLVAATAVAAAAAPPTPVARHTPTPRTPTGYDIAIVNLRGTGPNGHPQNALIATFKNVGTKTFHRTLDFRYWVRAHPGRVGGRLIAFSLAPGESFIYRPASGEMNYVKYGDTVEAVIYTDDDNESNNRMTKMLVRPVVMPRH